MAEFFKRDVQLPDGEKYFGSECKIDDTFVFTNQLPVEYDLVSSMINIEDFVPLGYGFYHIAKLKQLGVRSMPGFLGEVSPEVKKIHTEAWKNLDKFNKGKAVSLPDKIVEEEVPEPEQAIEDEPVETETSPEDHDAFAYEEDRDEGEPEAVSGSSLDELENEEIDPVQEPSVDDVPDEPVVAEVKPKKPRTPPAKKPVIQEDDMSGVSGTGKFMQLTVDGGEEEVIVEDTNNNANVGTNNGGTKKVVTPATAQAPELDFTIRVSEEKLFGTIQFVAPMLDTVIKANQMRKKGNAVDAYKAEVKEQLKALHKELGLYLS